MKSVFIDKIIACTVGKTGIVGDCSVAVCELTENNDTITTVFEAHYEATYSLLGVITTTSLAMNGDSVFCERDSEDTPTFISNYTPSEATLADAKDELSSYLRGELSCEQSPWASELFPSKISIAQAVISEIDAHIAATEVVDKPLTVTADVEKSIINIRFISRNEEIAVIQVACDMACRKYHLSDNEEEPLCNICIPISTIETRLLAITDKKGRQAEIFASASLQKINEYLKTVLVRTDLFDRVVTHSGTGQPLEALEFLANR